jgi:hypothetical protein
VNISLIASDRTVIDDILGSGQSMKIEQGITIHRSQLKLKEAVGWSGVYVAVIQLTPYAAPVALDHLLTYLYSKWKHDPKRKVRIEEFELELDDQERIKHVILRQIEAT